MAGVWLVSIVSKGLGGDVLVGYETLQPDRQGLMTATNAWWSEENLKRRRPFLDGRRAAVKGLRAFFQAEGFIEVDTPALQISPGTDRHIRPFATKLTEPFAGEGQPRYLRTSPEFAMKKILAGGQNASLGKIMQLCRVWRDGERSPLHHPEFTMLEWYRSNVDYDALIADCESVMRAASKGAVRALEMDGLFRWQGHSCDPNKPAQRVTVQDMFVRHAHIDLLATIDDPASPVPSPAKLKTAAQSRGLHVGANDTWEDIFFRVMIERIEPHLGIGAPTVLCEYPANLAALARRKPDDPRVAERFELYACGVELANAYSELTDPSEQRARFEHDQGLYEKLYGNAPPLDEELLEALAALPPCAGIALGFDRLVMLATGAEDITDVIWSPVP
tara:strand:+ start:1418 stop:2590 length:1173 start_codon:yes stop_codon:yes gene_type:complete